jgi:hypothetical protein
MPAPNREAIPGRCGQIPCRPQQGNRFTGTGKKIRRDKEKCILEQGNREIRVGRADSSPAPPNAGSALAAASSALPRMSCAWFAALALAVGVVDHV